jgi:hypothetical protein
VAMIFSPNMPALLGKAISHAAYSYLIVRTHRRPATQCPDAGR